MKKNYHKPIVKKVDYVFSEQITASSLPVQNYIDAWHTGKVCTWGEAACSIIYNKPKARGLDDCYNQGNIPLD